MCRLRPLALRLEKRAWSFAIRRWSVDTWPGLLARIVLWRLVLRRTGPIDFGLPGGSKQSFSAVFHYLRSNEAWKPHPLFDPAWYRCMYPDTAGVPALLHYARFGFNEGRSPHPLVNTDWLRREYRDLIDFFGEENIKAESINPFLTGSVSDILVQGNSHCSQTRYFNAKWVRDHYEDSLILWTRGKNALDLPFVNDALTYWTAFGRYQSELPSPHVLNVSEEGGLIDPGLTRAIYAEALGATLVHLEPVHCGTESYSGATCISSDRIVVLDSSGSKHPVGHFPEPLVSLTDSDIGVKSRNYRAVGQNWILLNPMPSISIRGQSIHLMHEYSSNYFHALVEVVGRYCMFLEDSHGSDAPATLLIDAIVPQSVQSLLRHIRRPQHTIALIPQGVQVKTSDLVFPRLAAMLLDVYRRPPQSEEQTINFRALQHLRREVLSMVAQTVGNGLSNLGPRIFIERIGSSRQLLNSEEITASLAQQGFQRYAPHQSTGLLEQVAVFQNADIVVSPTGAAVTNALFMRSGSKLVVLSGLQPSIRPELWDQLALVSGVVITHVRGPIARNDLVTGEMYVHHDYRVDVASILGVLID